MYLKTVKLKKKVFYSNRFAAINNCKSAAQFWKIVNATRPRASHLNNINSKTWFDYLKNCYPLTPNVSNNIFNWGCLSTFMLYKKGDTSNPENYRPITLMNCIAKIFTQIICDRLVS